MMKNRRLITLLLTLALSLTLLSAIGCNDSTQTTPEQTTPAPTTPPPSEPLVIYADGEYRAALVVPSEPTTLEKTLATKISAAITSRTRKSVPTMTYAEAVNSNYDAYILIGENGHPLSSELSGELGARSAKAELRDGCLVFSFNQKLSAEKVAQELIDLILASGEKISIPYGYLASYDAKPDLDGLPTHRGTTELSCGKGTTMRVGLSSPTEFAAYRTELETAGFELISDREAMGNLFATYRGESIYVYLYYTAYANEIRIITGPLSELVAGEYKIESDTKVDPFVASIPQPDNGQGYVMRLPDGRFIVQDGGYSGDDRVYATLRALQPEGTITIAAYFVSHPHGDHQEGFIEFIKTHRNNSEVTLERVIVNYGDPSRYNIDGTAGVETISDEVNWLYDTMRDYRSGVPVLKAHTGQIIDFGYGASVEILYTAEDLFPDAFPNINDSSMVIRFVAADTSVLFLADTCYLSGPILADLWGEHLKSDVMQIAHHGQWPSVEEIYHLIRAEVVLYPAVLRRLSGDLLDSRWDDQCEAVFTYAKDLYVSGDEMQILSLPYTLQNNKDAMIEFITNYVEQ